MATYSIDDIIDLKANLYEQFSLQYDSLRDVKRELSLINSEYTSKRYKIIEGLGKGKELRKDLVEMAVHTKMEETDKALLDKYDVLIEKEKTIELELDKLKAVSKELSDLIMVYGVKTKMLLGSS